MKTVIFNFIIFALFVSGALQTTVLAVTSEPVEPLAINKNSSDVNSNTTKESVPTLSYDFGDEDNDRVNDFFDECLLSFRGEVDEKGCPLDDDGDGVPNYRDGEHDSEIGAIVSLEGRTLSEDEYLEKEAIAHSDLYLLFPSLEKTTITKVPVQF